MGISGLMVVHNEEHNIAGALQTLIPWCDEVIIIDQESTDNTAEIAKSLGAKVFHSKKYNIPEPSLEMGIQNCANDYIFRLDGDERVPVELAALLVQVSKTDQFKIVAIPRVTYFSGVWITDHNWWPGYQYRFFLRNNVDIIPYVHGGIYPAPGKETFLIEAKVELAIHHFSYKNIHDWLLRMDRYTDLEIDRIEKIKANDFSIYSLQNFASEIQKIMPFFNEESIKEKSIADRNATIAMGLLTMAYQLVKLSKLWEFNLCGTQDEIAKTYKNLEMDLLSQWTQYLDSQN